MKLRSLWPIVALVAPSTARSGCQCRYVAEIDGMRSVFSELIETDFTKVASVATNKDWMRLEYTRTGRTARGPLGERYMPENVFSQPGAAGLQLRVNSTVDAGMVPSAELDSVRSDVEHGTFRARMRLPSMPASCAAFFWYHNDTQEMDIEFLTREFNRSEGAFPVNLVVHTQDSTEPGYNAMDAGTHLRVDLPFDPSGDFHEYRIDYLTDQVVFYADDQVLGRMNGTSVPTTAGHLILQHWSSGEPLWSAGPPEENSLLAVQYVKAYFNTPSGTKRDRGTCDRDDPEESVCEIPEGDSEHFFTDQDGQDGNEDEDGGNNVSPSALGLLAGIYILVSWVLFYRNPTRSNS